jgi:hypothetical protein
MENQTTHTNIYKIADIVGKMPAEFPQTKIEWLNSDDHKALFRCNIDYVEQPTDVIFSRIKEHCTKQPEWLKLTIHGSMLYYDDGLFKQ